VILFFLLQCPYRISSPSLRFNVHTDPPHHHREQHTVQCMFLARAALVLQYVFLEGVLSRHLSYKRGVQASAKYPLQQPPDLFTTTHAHPRSLVCSFHPSLKWHSHLEQPQPCDCVLPASHRLSIRVLVNLLLVFCPPLPCPLVRVSAIS
jgi:hypothetical protein